MKKIIASLLFFLSLITFACKHDHDHEDEDKNPPVVNIISPTEGATLDSLKFEIKVTDDEGLHEMSIVVTKDSDGSILYENLPPVHDLLSSLSIGNLGLVGITDATPLTLKVIAEDHGANKTVKTVKFVVDP
jgi:hypothetical protein